MEAITLGGIINITVPIALLVLTIILLFIYLFTALFLPERFM